LIGVAALVDSLAPEAHVAEHVARWWPMVIIALGVFGTIHLAPDWNAARGALLLTGTGIVLLVLVLDPFPPGIQPVVWAMAAIATGVGILVRLAVMQPRQRAQVITRLRILGSSRRLTWPRHAFSLADVLVLAGGCVLTIPRDGSPVADEGRISVTAVAGGVTLIVPKGWKVELTKHTVLGRVRPEAVPPSENAKPRLEISALLVFAGLRILYE
jgi:hypothetical protein